MQELILTDDLFNIWGSKLEQKDRMFFGQENEILAKYEDFLRMFNNKIRKYDLQISVGDAYIILGELLKRVKKPGQDTERPIPYLVSYATKYLLPQYFKKASFEKEAEAEFYITEGEDLSDVDPALVSSVYEIWDSKKKSLRALKDRPDNVISLKKYISKKTNFKLDLEFETKAILKNNNSSFYELAQAVFTGMQINYPKNQSKLQKILLKHQKEYLKAMEVESFLEEIAA